MISINEGSTALMAGMKVRHCRGSQEYYVVRVGVGLSLGRQALCVIRDHPDGIEAVVQCNELTQLDQDFEVKPERSDITLDSLDHHFDQRCDRLSIRADGVDDHIKQQIPESIRRLHQRCNEQCQMVVDLQSRLDERERIALGMQKNINALERTVENMEARCSKLDSWMDRVIGVGATNERRVKDWGVVFDELANRIAVTERSVLRVMNQCAPGPQTMMECVDCALVFAGTAASRCPGCDGANTQEHVSEDQEE